MNLLGRSSGSAISLVAGVDDSNSDISAPKELDSGGAKLFFSGSRYSMLLLLDRCDCQLGCAAECSEPWSLALFEFAQDATLEVNYCYHPFVLAFGAVVRSRQYGHFCFLDFFAVSILHFVISCHQQPAIPVAEAYDLGVFDVSLDISILIAKPLRKSLDRESGCS